MRIGTTVGLQLNGPQTIAQVIAEVRDAADLGLAGVWVAQVLSWDALTLLAAAGQTVPGIAFGTAVVPTYPRHPLALASQALTAQAATGNRLTLGIGTSHKPLVESTLGVPFDRPAVHTREYLTALRPLLRGEPVDLHGEFHHATGQVTVPGAHPPPVLLGALGPAMLRLAGELADGAIATWTGPRTLERHITPRITAAAHAAGRGAPRIVVSLPVAVTADAVAARAWVAERFGMAAELPSYRAMLDLEQVKGVEVVVLAGDEDTVAGHLRRLQDAGATEFIAVPFGPPTQVTRTLRLLADLSTEAPEHPLPGLGS
jgi:F420-dependent oxidoreductase-like protein